MLRRWFGATVAFVRAHPLVAIWVLAFAARALYVLRGPTVVFGDSREYDQMARDLLAGRGLVEEVGFVRPPLYPMFVAASYAIGGMAFLQFAQVVLGASAATLIGLLARHFSPRREGAWAAALYATFYPWFFQLIGVPATETLFTFVAVLTFLALLRAAERRSIAGITLGGVLFGAACLIRANLLVLAPPLALWFWWLHRRPQTALAFTVAVAGALAPYTAYNWLQGSGLVIASSGGGLNFYVGNNPNVALLYSPSIPDEEWRVLNDRGVLEARSLAFLGCAPAESLKNLCAERVPLAQRERFFYEAAFRYIQSAPGEWASTSLAKMARGWVPWVEPRAYALPLVIASGVSFGLVLALVLVSLFRGMPRPAGGFLVAVAAAMTLTSLLVLVQLRYRFALLDPVLIAAAGGPLQNLLERVSASVTRRSSALVASEAAASQPR